MTKAKKPKVPKQPVKSKAVVIDVRKPGNITPPSSAKPIIVTNRPILQDPMVVAEPEPSAPARKLPSERPKIAPAAAEPTTDPPATPEETVGDPPSQPAASDTPTSAPPEGEAPPQTDRHQKPTKGQPHQTGDAATAEEPSDEPAHTPEEASAAAQDPELEKLIENHTYYLPINQVEKRRNRQSVVLGVIFIIILGLAWADVALDAGIISIPGIKAPTHFFK